ncbi:hypothetical protein N7478_007736 [Penicillium angulare]|uniref:uncharacterized protein n=1 Tax=Penicillium angulare TaxID=116970 RepID=UPI0025423268|nr:uncharacterized protein N7478_007736 [Penicillium angulare]KAJ5272611.1 hypothetical protein N7478_007736 [Penicillium angulare]
MALPSDEDPSDGRRSNRDDGRPSDSNALERREKREKRKLEKSHRNEVQRRYEAQKEAEEKALAYKELYDRLVEYEIINEEEKKRNARLETEVRSLRGQLNSETERADVNEWNIGKAEEMILEMENTAEAQRKKWKEREEELQVRLKQERDTSARLRHIIKQAAADVNICRVEVSRSTNNRDRLQQHIQELETCLQESRDEIIRDRERLEEFLSTTEEAVAERTHSLHTEMESRIFYGPQSRNGESDSIVRSPCLFTVDVLDFPFGCTQAKATKVRADRPRLNLLEESRYTRRTSFYPKHRSRTSLPNTIRLVNESAPSKSFEEPLFSPFSESDEPFNHHPRSHCASPAHSESPPPSPEHFWSSTQVFNPNQRPLDLELELASEDFSDLEDTSVFNSRSSSRGPVPSPPASFLDKFFLPDTESDAISSNTSLPLQLTMQIPVPEFSRKRVRFTTSQANVDDYITGPTIGNQLAAGGANINSEQTLNPEELPSPPKRAKVDSPHPLRRPNKIRKLAESKKHRIEMQALLEFHRRRQQQELVTPPPEPSPSPPPVNGEDKPLIHRYLKCPELCPYHDVAPFPVTTEVIDLISLLPQGHRLRVKRDYEESLIKPPTPESQTVQEPALENTRVLTPSSDPSVVSKRRRLTNTKQNTRQNKSNRISKKSTYKSSNPKMPGSWPRESRQNCEVTININVIERLEKAAEKTKSWIKRTARKNQVELVLGAYVFTTVFGPTIQHRLEQTFSPLNAFTPEAINNYRELYEKDELTWFGIWFFDIVKYCGLDRATMG